MTEPLHRFEGQPSTVERSEPDMAAFGPCPYCWAPCQTVTRWHAPTGHLSVGLECSNIDCPAPLFVIETPPGGQQ